MFYSVYYNNPNAGHHHFLMGLLQPDLLLYRLIFNPAARVKF